MQCEPPLYSSCQFCCGFAVKRCHFVFDAIGLSSCGVGARDRIRRRNCTRRGRYTADSSVARKSSESSAFARGKQTAGRQRTHKPAKAMGLCKCPKRQVTTQFCFEHRVNVCENCMVVNHTKVNIARPVGAQLRVPGERRDRPRTVALNPLLLSLFPPLPHSAQCSHTSSG